MRLMLARYLAAVALSLGSTAYAVSIASTCPETDICFQLNVPETTATSGQGDIYFQISASTSYEWVALGQGTQMAGANIFVVYTSSDGQNVTVSPRLGVGHVMPQHVNDAQISLLGGSGVSNGRMVANVRCSNCNSWNGGRMDFTNQSSNWIQAHKSGPTLDSDDLTENISQHDDAAPFVWDMTRAKGGDEANPFLAGSVATTTATGLATSSTSATSQASNTQEGNRGGYLSNHAVGAQSMSKVQHYYMDIAHATVACLAFVAIFPTGAILARVASFPVWAHAALQAIGYLFLLIALGLGVVLANYGGEWHSAHPGIGVFLFVLLSVQPILGMLHHKLYKKYGHRTIWSYAHLTVGRIALLLGMVNGGLGLQLAGASRSGRIAYSVITAIVGATYIAVIVFDERKRIGQRTRKA